MRRSNHKLSFQMLEFATNSARFGQITLPAECLRLEDLSLKLLSISTSVLHVNGRFRRLSPNCYQRYSAVGYPPCPRKPVSRELSTTSTPQPKAQKRNSRTTPRHGKRRQLIGCRGALRTLITI